MSRWSKAGYFMFPTAWMACGVVWATAKHDLAIGFAYEGLAVFFAVLSWLKWRRDRRDVD